MEYRAPAPDAIQPWNQGCAGYERKTAALQAAGLE